MSESEHKDVEIVETKCDHGAPLSKTLRSVESVDSFHHDEAARILAEYVAAGGPEDWSSLEEKNLIRKIDRRLLPVLAFTFFLTWYDKGILSQAVSICFLPQPPQLLRSTIIIYWLTLLPMVGHLRSERRPEARSWQPLFFLVRDILYWVSHWVLAHRNVGPKIPHSTRCFGVGHDMGRLCLTHSCLFQLSWSLYSAFLPRVSRKWCLSNFHPYQCRSICTKPSPSDHFH